MFEETKALKVVVLEVGKAPEVRLIMDDLKAFQQLVGGYVETTRMFGKVLCVCNEEGKLEGMPPNFLNWNADMIVGNVFFVAHDGNGEFRSLNDAEVICLQQIFIDR